MAVFYQAKSENIKNKKDMQFVGAFRRSDTYQNSMHILYLIRDIYISFQKIFKKVCSYMSTQFRRIISRTMAL